jgi:hypothetical protein
MDIKRIRTSEIYKVRVKYPLYLEGDRGRAFAFKNPILKKRK